MEKGYIEINENSIGNIIYKTNSNDFLIASSFEGELFKIQTSIQKVVLKTTLNNDSYLNANTKSSGFLDEINGYFYLATTSNNTSVQISIFSFKDLQYLDSLYIYNENIPFIDNCIFADDSSMMYFIATNYIYKIQFKDGKLKKINSVTIPDQCIVPSSAIFSLDRNLLLLGCISKFGSLYEINLLNLTVSANHIYYYGEGIDSLILGPTNSFSFLEGTKSYPYHLVSFTFKDISNSNYRNRETYFGKPITASSDNERYALYVFSHDILLFDLTDISNNPYDIDYLEHEIGLSSVYNSLNNIITISTNSSKIYFYQLPTSIPNSLQKSSVYSLLYLFPIVIVIFLSIIIGSKIFYSRCCKIKKDEETYKFIDYQDDEENDINEYYEKEINKKQKLFQINDEKVEDNNYNGYELIN